MELKQNLENWAGNATVLLIVPYGIETTSNKVNLIIILTLLIVPYGIETLYQDEPFIQDSAFNRTLWNWNPELAQEIKIHPALLIVPYGIETTISDPGRIPGLLLIVPYGIET